MKQGKVALRHRIYMTENEQGHINKIVSAFKDSTPHPTGISLSEKKDIICAINPLRWKETKLGNQTLTIPVGRPTRRWELHLYL